jgi:hypothetical protein
MSAACAESEAAKKTAAATLDLISLFAIALFLQSGTVAKSGLHGINSNTHGALDRFIDDSLAVATRP